MANRSNNSNDIILDINVRYEDAVNGIVRYRNEINRARDDQRLFEAEFQRGEITREEYNRSMEESSAFIEVNRQRIRSLRREIQANLRVEQEQTDSINARTAQLQILNREYERLGAGAERDALGRQILTLQNELNELNAARGRFQGQVGNYEEAIRNALGVNSEFANSILELSRNAQTGDASLSTFFQNAIKSVQAFGKALKGLLTNPVFLTIVGIVGAGAAFKFWFDYNKGLVEATRLTKQFTGLAGNDLKAYRNEVQAIAETFDKDFKEVLIAANAVSKQFGISQQEAITLVKDGFIAGADANGEYLNTLKEYPAFFKEAGISASEFIAITAETANQGVFSDKGIDAIKEANLRLREMNTSTAQALDNIGISSKKVQEDLKNGSKSTFDIMKEVSSKLDEFPEQSQQVGKAVADIFGSAGEDAGLQYLKSLKNINTNLESVKLKAGELGKIQEKQLNANIELQNAVAALFDKTGGVFESLIGNAKIFVTESLTSVVKGIINVINKVIDLYNESSNLRSVIQATIAFVKSLFSVVKELFMLIIDSGDAVGRVFQGIFTLDYDKINQASNDFFRNISKRASNIGDQVGQNIATGINKSLTSGNINKIVIPKFTKFKDLDLNALGTKDGEDKTDKDKDKYSNALNKIKQTAEAESKAALELAKFKLETEIKSQKDLADNQKLGFEERIKAIQSFNELQKKYILFDKDQQLKQADLTASQKALIEEKASQKLIELEKEYTESVVKITKDLEDKQLEAYKTNLENRLAIIKQGSDSELTLRLQQLQLQRDEEIKAAEETGADIFAIKLKYQKLEDQERRKQAEFINAQRQKEYDNQILQAQLNNQNTLLLQVEAKKLELSSIKQLETESDIDFLNRKLTLQNEIKTLDDQFLAYQLEIRTQSMQAFATIAGGFNDLLSTIAEDNAAFSGFVKATALFEIGLNQASALAKGIASASALPFPANLPAIASVIGSITGFFSQVFKLFNSSKQPKAPAFASGGLVTGAGSGTSDSINARLSNGESVLTARATSMFAPVLSAFNQIGGGVPISTQSTASQIAGEEMLARAFAKAVQSLPNPVVSVEEIDNVNNRVNVLESSSRL